jgi:filamentous hemagglutinin family protein
MMKNIELYPQQQILILNIATVSSFKRLVHSIVTLGVCSGFTIPASAQITTGGDGTAVNQTNGTFNITGGTPSASGTNLFHSFGEFGLNTNQVANFVQPNASVQNILGRVTGGLPSSIDGRIQVTGGTANLYLMNPAGIVFGKNASLNINGAFTATTAKALDFGNGNWFNALGANTYGNLNGNPIGFAFPGSTPGSIFSAATFDATNADPTKQTTKPGQSITLVGGTVISTGDIKTAGGNISIATVEGGKYVEIADGSILRLYLPASPTNITSEAKAFTALSLPGLLTNTGIDLAATGVKNENGMVTLVGDPSAIKAAADVDKAQAVVDASNKTNSPRGASSEEFAAVATSKKALEAVTAVGDSRMIESDIKLGDTVSKQNRSIDPGDVITRNLDTRNISKGGNIHIKSSQAILSGQINTNSQRSSDPANQIYRGGNVVIDAQTELKTKIISSSSVVSNNGSIKNTTGGNVTLSTQTKDIIVDSIYTAASTDENSYDPGTKLTKAQSTGFRGGNVTIKAAGLFRVITTDGINTSLFGDIDIEHGSKLPFASGVTGESVSGQSDRIIIPGFTFPDGASGSRGAIVTSRGTNGSIGVIYKDQSIDGISIKSVFKDTNPVTPVIKTDDTKPVIKEEDTKPVAKKDDNNTVDKKDDNNTVAKKDDNNTVTKDEKQKSKQDCTPSSTAVAANSTTDPNRSQSNASVPSADPCQLVTGTAGGTLQILNNKN